MYEFGAANPEAVVVLFSVSGLTLHGAAAPAALRIRMTIEGETVRIEATDESDGPVASIRAIRAREVDPAQLDTAAPQEDGLLALEWIGVDLPAGGEPEPEAPTVATFACAPDPNLDPVAATHTLCAQVLERLQEEIAGEDPGTRTAFVTTGAMAVTASEPADPAAAAVWGLVRSAQSEHPGRFALIDTDGSEASEAALTSALQVEDEPQLALREGGATAPRLAKATPDPTAEPPALDPEGTVLVTGGLSGLGALTARHLAERHGAKRLLLSSRRGPGAPGAAELIAELESLGAEATAVACDVAEREQVEALLGGILGQHPLTAVFHCAGVLDDGVIESLDADRLDAVLAPKADAAWHLHELTAEMQLSAFVLYSSAAAAIGSPGQANYAAANSFLDALAQRRAAAALPATAIAWGIWEQGMGAALGEAGRARIQRGGLVPIEARRGLALLDLARAQAPPLAFAAPLHSAGLRDAAAAGMLPPLLSGLVRTGRRRPKAAGACLARRLAGVPEAEREALVLELVREQAAGVLGHASAAAVDPEASFKDLGFDSLGAVELRNRLAGAAGVSLDATLLFDHPNATAVAAHLLEQVEGSAGAEVVVHAARGSEEPVAIVGMSCRFPGQADTPERLWELLGGGTDAVTGFPVNRGWDLERIYDPDPDRPGATYTREGGFLHEAGDFDAAFFGISPREALAMDPQQRLLLEGAWEALEHAGIDPAVLRGSDTGVFAGMAAGHYIDAGSASGSAELGGYVLTGVTGSVASGRVAYALGLEGPALTVDTACSSSLVAMHLAAQAIRSGECSLALAGGVTVMATAEGLVEFSHQRVLSADARCRSFSATADGTGFSEGSGLLLLERLSEAQRNGRRILAVIRGSATNQDGASNGLTAPNGPSQERVIRQALANAGLAPSEVDAVEAHGTGTTLGDPIEAQALLNTYGQDRDNGPLALGSLKSNIGHTQAAAGVGGVIKMVMALRNEALPRTLHVDEPTPHVDWSAGEIELLTEQREWPRGDRPRRAGVSSFGISGTNAHLILEEAPEQPAAPESTAGRPSVLPWALSAKTPEALAEAAGRLAAHVEAKEPDPLDVAHTLLGARAQLEHRAVVVGADRDELLEGLDALAQGKASPNVLSARAASQAKPVFVFSGQGSQWLGMGAALLDESPLFAERIARCEVALAPYMETRLTELLRSADESWLGRVELVQPALFALMVSLAELWRHHGVEPGAVVGHSQGEIAAAVVAGALSLEDGAKLAALRAQALLPLIGKGEMTSVAASPEQIEEILAAYGDRIAVAAHNGPAATVLSGEPEAIEELVASLEEQGMRARLIPVGYASHCAQVEAVEDELKQAIAGIEPSEARIPFYSTVTGEPIDATELDASYWYRNLRQPVRFHEATRRLLSDGYSAFVEASPHPVLAMAIQESAEAEDRPAAVLHTLRREEGGARRFVTSLAAAHANGIAVDFSPLFEGTGAAFTELPTYPFQRQRFWLRSSGAGGDASALGQSPTEHPLLGAAISLAGEGVLLTGRVSLETHPWLADHAVAGTAILPGTGFVELALRAGQEVGASFLQELILEAPLVLPEFGAVQLQVNLSREEETEAYRVEIYSRLEAAEESADGEESGGEGGESPWTRHASGALNDEEPRVSGFDATAWPPPGAEPLDTEAFYDAVAAVGLDYGPAFQGLEAAWKLGQETYAEVSLAEEQGSEAERFGVHPALLDAALQAGLLGADASEGVKLPFSFGGVCLHEASGASALRVRIASEGEKLRLQACDQEANPVASIESLSVRALDPAQPQLQTKQRDALFGIEWTEAELPDGAEGTGQGEAEDAGVELFECVPDPKADPAEAAHALCAEVLQRLQAEIAREDNSRLAFLTRGAMSLESAEAPDPAAAAAWGLVRSAQSEHPGRFTLIDTDGSELSQEALAAALQVTEEPQLALREGRARAPRLAKATENQELALPTGAWRLIGGEGGTLEEISALESQAATRPLAANEVRVAVHAAGLNFRDVLIALGIYPGEASIGSEGAGVVLEVGSGVSDLDPGERVFGLIPEAFGPAAITERRALVQLPGAWSFAEGAAVPIVFATAHHGLRDLANLQPGERVLVHAGAGGVGMAAIQISRHLGAEVFATASPSKWETLRSLGLDDDHIASSRDLEFKEKFLAATAGEGVDVVLDSLAREFVDASLALLPRGGRFVEMGKTDVRDPEEVAEQHPGVSYRAFDLFEAGPERTEEILAELLDLFERGALAHAPIAPWDIREAPSAFRYLSQARHTGKLVLTVPQPLDPEGTVLVTGGLSGLGALTARHLADEHGARHLLLSSRRGAEAPGAAELIAELAELGCEARAVACDVSERQQLEALLAGIPAEHPLSAVVHCAGTLDDGVIEALDPSRLDNVLAPKADAAWHLHELTRELELSSFVLFSSVAATLGAPGQGNYAAANSFLDALAHRRRAEGLPATAIAWGLWERESDLTAGAEQERLARGGLVAIATEQGLELLDRARSQAAPLGVATPLDTAVLRAAAAAGMLPPLLSGLVGANRRRARSASAGLARRLASVPEAEREALVLALVHEHAAAVLGHSSAAAIDPAANFKDLGFDSLSAVELRNRLAQASGVRLEATLAFDYPTPAAISRHLLERIDPNAGGDAAGDPAETEIRRLLASIPPARLREAGLLEMLRALEGDGSPDLEADGEQSSIDTMDIDSLVRQTLETETAEG